MAIEIQQAVKTARDFLMQLFPNTGSDIRLEEIEKSSDGTEWLVTLSFPGPPVEVFGAPLPSKRIYKIVRVDAALGKPEGIRIRELAS